MKSVGCSLEIGETGVVCVCVEADLANICVRGWPGRGAGLLLAEMIAWNDCIISREDFKMLIYYAFYGEFI